MCVVNMALMAAGASSSGGLAAFAVSKFCRKKQTQTKRKQDETRRETNGNRIGS
jgi:membrane protein YqaA with SNARE-associated domain